MKKIDHSEGSYSTNRLMMSLVGLYLDAFNQNELQEDGTLAVWVDELLDNAYIDEDGRLCYKLNIEAWRCLELKDE